MAYKDDTFNTFSDKVFSSAPVPGGGAVAPLAAALGAALDGMSFRSLSEKAPIWTYVRKSRSFQPAAAY